MKALILRTTAFLTVVSVFIFAVACKATPSPTESYKKLFAAVKSKNTDEIKKWMSEKTLSFAEGVAAQQKKPIEKVFENGFTATTFATEVPKTRDERIKENMGALEVWNSKDQRWEDLPFVNEGGEWKLAIGDLFAGTYEKPSKGQAERESEESNKMNNGVIQAPAANINMNAPVNGGKNPIPQGMNPNMPVKKPLAPANSNAPVNK